VDFGILRRCRVDILCVGVAGVREASESVRRSRREFFQREDSVGISEHIGGGRSGMGAMYETVAADASGFICDRPHDVGHAVRPRDPVPQFES